VYRTFFLFGYKNVVFYSSPSIGTVYDHCMNPEMLQRLVEVQMPYGKYKGRLIADLPGNYLNWFAREGFPKGELGQLLALMQELDHNGLAHLLKPLRSVLPRGPAR
jgi:uncharacterized protein (DUF3820 family)